MARFNSRKPVTALYLSQCAAAVAVAMLTLSGAAHAQQATDTSEAQQSTDTPADANAPHTVKVTGNWLSTPSNAKVLEHPGARSIVVRQRIEESGSTSVRDVLRQIPGVQVQESNGTGGSDVSLNVGIRGLTARLSPRSTVLMDGVPMSYAPYGQPQLSLAPLALDNLESVDVVRGAGSVRYGPQNVGGIINFVTRAIPKDFKAGISLGSELYSHGSDVKGTPSFYLGGTNEQGLGGMILYSGVHGDGYRAANDKISIDDLMLKGSYRISPNDTLYGTVHHFEGQGDMPGGLTTAQYAQNPFQSNRPYDQFTGRRTDTSLKYAHNDGVNNAEVLAYYVDSFRGSFIEQEGSGASNGQRRLTTAPRSYHYFGIEPRYSRLFETGPVSQEISVGYRYLKESSSEVAGRTGYYKPAAGFDAFGIPMLTYQTSQGGTTAHAVYIDNRISIGNWTITPGVRVEDISTFNNVTNFATNGKITSALYPSIDSRETLPTLSVLYRLSDRWTVFANAGKSFGPQQYAQLASTTDGLHPEMATTYEIGTHINGTAWGGEVTLFNIDFDKELQLARSIVGDGMWTDLGATRHRGVESAVRYDLSDLNPALKGLSVSANFTYTQALSQAGAFQGMDLPFYSRQVGSLGARYVVDRWTFNADVFANSKQRSPDSPVAGATYVTKEDATGRLGNIPGYGTLAVRGGYDFGKQFSNLKLAVGIKNVLDRRYFTRSTDNNGGKYVGQPRTLYFQSSLAF